MTRRVLLASIDARGHIALLEGLAQELARRHVEVVWFKAPIEPLRGSHLSRFIRSTADRALEHGQAAVAAIERTRPDAAVVEFGSFGAALACESQGLPWACVQTPHGLTAFPPPGLEQAAGRVSWSLAQAAKALGARALDWPLRSPLLTLSIGPPCTQTGLPSYAVPVGSPSEMAAPATPTSPETWVVTLGTSIGHHRDFLRSACNELAKRGATVHASSDQPIEGLDPRVRMQAWLPLTELLGRASGLVCHGGLNTVTEAIARGVPMVIAPGATDQLLIGPTLARAGLARIVALRAPDPVAIARAMDAIRQPNFVARAAIEREQLAALGGPTRMADLLLERL